MNSKVLLAFSAFLLWSCHSTKNISKQKDIPVVELDTVKVFANLNQPVYRAAETKYFDLVHTALDVKFDWEKQYLYGKENVWLTPHFYPQNNIALDAKGMDIHSVKWVEDKTQTETDLTYKYDGMVLSIALPKTVTRNDTIHLFIDYTAKPEEFETSGSAAIAEDKGLYFINPLGKEPNKPKQIWTQGETEANSRWFPTIDSPNQKSTEEIKMTVDTQYVTLSNGLLVMSELNGDGTRTDVWEMNQKHAPYLFMMAVGDFAVVKDKWRDIEVNYYVEHPYKKYAKAIFGNTPEMLEFYSQRLGYTYPWPKYHQVVVRDYVSGAMENTSAVIHGEFLQRTSRELLDNSNEDIIAHELFHHWFGDLLTCESWSNLPLNESFATYGEYLWLEYKYGQDEADYHIYQDLMRYLRESQSKQENLIRFHYDDKEDMFDAHSYQKGGRVLHMLRTYVGDDAFFTAIKKYLHQYQYQAVEVHNLRLVFEEVTGEDLNWFFNQWFLSSGHPMLDINYSYNNYNDSLFITIEQLQDFETTPLFKLPVKIDIYKANGQKESHTIIINKQKEVFTFKVNKESEEKKAPLLVNFDADKSLLCEKVDNKPKEWLNYQFYHAPLFLDRYEAVSEASHYSDSLATKLIFDALSDKFWAVRLKALKAIANTYSYGNIKDELKQKLIELALKDEKSSVRSEAIAQLEKYYGSETVNVYKKALNDSSYMVESEALMALYRHNKQDALKFAEAHQNTRNSNLLISIAAIYAKEGTEAHNSFFQKSFTRIDSYSKYSLVLFYGEYLQNQSYQTIKSGLPYIFDIIENGGIWWLRLAGYNAAYGITEMLSNRKQVLKDEIKASAANPQEQMQKRDELKEVEELETFITTKLEEFKAKEKNKTLLNYLKVNK